jgi:hypothetical protein
MNYGTKSLGYFKIIRVINERYGSCALSDREH